MIPWNWHHARQSAALHGQSSSSSAARHWVKTFQKLKKKVSFLGSLHSTTIYLQDSCWIWDYLEYMRRVCLVILILRSIMSCKIFKMAPDGGRNCRTHGNSIPVTVVQAALNTPKHSSTELSMERKSSCTKDSCLKEGRRTDLMW